MKLNYLLALLFTSSLLSSQNPVIDNTFNAQDNGDYRQNPGEGGQLLSSGKILTIYAEQEYSRYVIRLNADGGIDNTFSSHDTAGQYITNLFARADGKFLTVGYNANDLRLFNADGTLDANFTPPVFATTAVGPYVGSAIVQADDKIIIIGNFLTVNGIDSRGIVRLNFNGSIDNTFVVGTGFNETAFGDTEVYALTRTEDGKYFVGGGFITYNGTSKRHILKLNADGTIDHNFNVVSNGTQTGFYDNVSKIIVQPDGKVLAASALFTNNGSGVGHQVIRLSATGVRDTSFFFSFQTGENDYTPNDICLQADGKIILQSYSKLVRLNATGTLDTSFSYVNPSHYSNFYQKSLTMLPDGKILVNGNYKSPAGLTRSGIYRLNTNGTLDLTFNPQSGSNLHFYESEFISSDNESMGINAVTLLDQKILLMGRFTAYNDIPARKILRLTESGLPDIGFNLDPSVAISYEYKLTVKQQSDGKLVIAKGFTSGVNNYITVNGAQKNLIRLNENGSIDNTFNFPYAASTAIKDLIVQPDGKILLIGNGPLFMAGTRYKILRLNSDGSVDNTFTPTSFYFNIQSFQRHPDGSIYAIASDSPNNANFLKLNRLNANGLADPGFATSFNGTIDSFKIDPNGKIMISYTSGFSGYMRIIRLNANGTIDSSFTLINNLTDDPLRTLYFTTDNNIIAYGDYSVNYVNTDKIFHLFSPTGTYLSSFGNYMSTGSRYSPGIAMQGCDKLIVTDNFFEFSEVPKNNMVRYNLNGIGTPVLHAPTGPINQTFSAGQTLADLNVIGQNIQWYNEQSSCAAANSGKMANLESVLPPSTLLVSGTTYYASQTIDGSESSYRLPVTVTGSLGTAIFELNNLNVFPNPVINSLHISSLKTVNTVEIYDTIGQQITSQSFSGKSVKVDFSNYGSGIYFVKIYSDNGIQTAKILKQ